MLPAICCHMAHEALHHRRAVPHIRTLRKLQGTDQAVFFLAFVPAFNMWLTATVWN